MEPAEGTYWRKCSSCKKPLAFGARYYQCSVSTCNGQRTGYVFCSVPCFEVHLPSARHKDAAAMEARAPQQSAATSSTTAREPQRTIIKSESSSSATNPNKKVIPRDVLIIASRLKDYIQARSEMNTSADVMDVLSDYVRVVCDRAMENARSDGRKTVMGRDFQFLKK